MSETYEPEKIECGECGCVRHALGYSEENVWVCAYCWDEDTDGDYDSAVQHLQVAERVNVAEIAKSLAERADLALVAYDGLHVVIIESKRGGAVVTEGLQEELCEPSAETISWYDPAERYGMGELQDAVKLFFYLAAHSLDGPEQIILNRDGDDAGGDYLAVVENLRRPTANSRGHV